LEYHMIAGTKSFQAGKKSKALVSRLFVLVMTLGFSVSIGVPAAFANGCGNGGPNGGPFDGGEGSAGSPFLVSTAGQLQDLDLGVCLGYEFRQTNNIDLSGVTWTPIGTSADFTGKYDGGFHVISGLSVSGATNAGLFGTISAATIKNLILSGPVVSGSGNTGALVGYTRNGSTITKVLIQDGSVTSTGNLAGGITGMTQGAQSSITLVAVDAAVSGAANAGGLVGQVESGSASITDVSFQGSVFAGGQSAGGIVGYGINQIIDKAYSIGTITGANNHRGGIIGLSAGESASTTNSFFLDTGVTQLSSNYATAKTSTELKTLSTYSGATWAITDGASGDAVKPANNWVINEAINSSNPILAWQVGSVSSSDFLTAQSGGQVVAPTRVSATYAGVTREYLDWVLTDNAGNRAGAIWYKTRLNLSGDFEINAEIYLGDSNAGADGLAFVLQQNNTNSVTVGGGLGFNGIVPALAVEFDTYPNGVVTDHTDVTNDYWGIYNNPSVENGSAGIDQAVDPDNVAGTDVQFSLGDIEDGLWRAVRFSWVASSKTFQARIDNNRDGDFADSGELLSKTGLTLTGVRSTFGSNPVYAGFTASTGGLKSEQRVRFSSPTGLSARTFANNAPTIQDQSNQVIDLAGGAQNVDLTIADSATLQSQWRVSVSSSNTGVATATASITSATNARVALTPVAAGQSTVTVTVTDADGVSVSDSFVVTVTVTLAAVPGAATSITAAATDLSVNLSWTAPASDGGSPVTGYRVEYSINAGANWSAQTANTGSSATTATFTGLTAGESYLFRLYTFNAVGNSVVSTVSNSVDIVAPVSNAPSAPYVAPTITGGFSIGTVPADKKVAFEITGTNLEEITRVTVGDIEVRIVSQTANKLNLELPALTPGPKDLTFFFIRGSLTQKSAFVVSELSEKAAVSKVNAGLFKGFVALYAKGHEGKRFSAKVGKDWVVIPSLGSNFERIVEFTGVGYELQVRIFIDRVLVDTISLTTK
jgi:hypothetical protein